MTVETTDNRVNYIGDGVTEDFIFAFKTFDESTIRVYEDNVLTVGTVVVTLNGNQDASPGGSVNVTPAPALGVVVSVVREEELSQGVDYITGGAFPSETHERALDKLTFINQQQQDGIDRSIKTGLNAPAGTDYTLPVPVADRAIKWNATANAFENSAGDPDQAQADAAAQVVLAQAQVALAQAEVANCQAEVINAQNEVALAAAQVALADASATAAQLAQTAAEVAQAAAEAAAAGVNLPSIGVGDAGRILRVNAAENGYELVTRHRGCLLIQSSGQVITSGSYQNMSWSAEEYDTDSIHDLVTNPERISIPAGVSFIKLSAFISLFGSPSIPNLISRFTLNGGTSFAGQMSYERDSSVPFRNMVYVSTPFIQVTPGDYFTVQLFQDSGSDVSTSFGVTQSWVEAEIK